MWGYAMAHGDRSVDVFVRKLRQKLRTGSPTWNYIHTHFGVGYRFSPEREDGDLVGVGEPLALPAAEPLDELDPRARRLSATRRRRRGFRPAAARARGGAAAVSDASRSS